MTEKTNPLMTEAGMTDAWQSLAMRLRAGLKGLGIEVTACLPGEPDDCGADYAHHALSYAAAITAHGMETLLHLHHGDPDIEQAGNDLVRTWRETYRTNSQHCSKCVPAAGGAS